MFIEIVCRQTIVFIIMKFIIKKMDSIDYIRKSL
nr:MAG TPA: hypothetical protein [Crassvirales sp.]